MKTEYVLVGAGFAFAAAVQPGPLQAFLLSNTLAHGWRRTLPAACSPLLSDGPIALIVLLLLTQVPAGFERAMRIAGGVLLVYLAVAAFGEWRQQPRTTDPASAPATLLKAAAVNILNPNPYLGWSLVLGPLILEAWSSGPTHAIAVLVAFYGTMVAALSAIIIVFGTLRGLAPRVVRVLLFASALTLLALGIYQLGTGITLG